MKKIMIIAASVFLCLFAINLGSAEAVMIFDLELHNPAGGPPTSDEPAGVKSQFIMQNQSTAGEKISTIEWLFAPGVFVDPTSGGVGVGGWRAGSVELADNVGFLGTALSDGDTSILFGFTGFDQSEVFEFWTDLDADVHGRVGNSDFNGSQTIVEFDDGTKITYDWVLPDNRGRSFYALGAGGGGNNTVPEPATMVLFGSGLLGAFVRRKFK